MKKSFVRGTWQVKRAFSPAVITEGTARTIYVAGHTGQVDDAGKSLAGDFDESIAFRMGYNEAALKIWQTAPIFGVGPGGFVPALALVDPDDAATNERQTLALLEQHPQLAGIYNIGGASDGVARALKLAGREQKVVFIGHGLTPDTRALLIDGTLDAVITQSPQSVVGNAVRIFANLRDGRDALAGVETLRLSIVLRENLP